MILLPLVGCSDQPEIREYTSPKKADVFAANHAEGAVEKNTSIASTGPSEPTDRMLAAIVPHGEKAWFFKLTGPIDSVAEIDEAFHAFIGSVRFDEEGEGEPAWDTPEGWDSKPASQMRFATLVVPAPAGPLELAVSSLGYSAEDHDSFLLANINRWRGQMKMSPLSLLEMPQNVEEIKVSGAKATLVDLVGNFGAGGMRPPFAGGGGSATLPENHPPIKAPEASPNKAPNEAPPSSAAKAPSSLKFAAPEGWEEFPPSGFRKASFAVEADGEKVEITIIDLAAGAGELLPNVNRWRAQVKLDAIDEEQLAKDAQEIEGENWQGKYFVLAGPESAESRETILGVITVVGERSWFIKLSGAADLAERERENFESFARSVQF